MLGKYHCRVKPGTSKRTVEEDGGHRSVFATLLLFFVLLHFLFFFFLARNDGGTTFCSHLRLILSIVDREDVCIRFEVIKIVNTRIFLFEAGFCPFLAIRLVRIVVFK